MRPHLKKKLKEKMTLLHQKTLHLIRWSIRCRISSTYRNSYADSEEAAHRRRVP
jgi:hypothetical protein